MKSLIASSIAVAAVVTLAACGGGTETAEQTPATEGANSATSATSSATTTAETPAALSASAVTPTATLSLG